VAAFLDGENIGMGGSSGMGAETWYIQDVIVLRNTGAGDGAKLVPA
jgi:hypothetical protein